MHMSLHTSMHISTTAQDKWFLFREKKSYIWARLRKFAQKKNR